jgi:hypothetical protein
MRRQHGDGALAAVRERRKSRRRAGRCTHWVHVKGHSADGGNNRADKLVQWEKTSGPYCRVREGGGEGAGRYGAATTAALATAMKGDSAMGQIDGSVPARRSFGAAR